MSTKLPLVVILGSTGSGKTKLSLELATKFGGEIIGADSMQIYKGLNIASAKATNEELATAPHHMINILEPNEKYTVIEYRNRVLPIIENLLDRNKLPIIVGGTNYYIESILWKILVQNPEDKSIEECGVLPNNEHELSSQELHEKLKKLDPAMAKRLHPNNKRKILRSLEVLHHKGIKLSDILAAQVEAGGSTSGGGLRYDNVFVLWLQCDQQVLDKRLDERVEKMIDQGLLEELLNFHKLYNKERIKDNREADYTKGIFQSIGFKEFHSYLLLSEEERTTKEGQKIYRESLERLKLVTRRYARKQSKWTVNRFLGRKDRQVPPVYGLDTTDISKWTENVTLPAHTILESYITNTKCDIQALPMRDINSIPNSLDETYNCKVCKRVFIGEKQWEIHVKSPKHKKVLQKVKKSAPDSKNSAESV